MRLDACEATRVRGEQSPELLDLRMACLVDRVTELRTLTEQLLAADRAALGRALDAVRGLESIDACARAAMLRAGGHRATDPGAPERRDRLARAQSLALIGDRTHALELARGLATDASTAGDREIEGRALRVVGKALTAKGDVPGAEQALYGAIAAAHAAAADELAAEVWLDLVWLIGDEAARPAEAHRFARIAQGVIDRLGGAPQLQGVLEDRVGVLLYNEARYDEAAPHLERGLALREQVFGQASTQAAASLQHIALLRTAQGKPALALELHRRARENVERVLGPAHPDVLVYAEGEAAAAFEVGKVDDSLALLERTLAALQRVDPDDERDAADLLINIGIARRKRGDLALARDAIERGAAIHARIAGPDSLLVATALANLGMVLSDLGLHDDAQARLARALAIQDKALGPDHPDLAETHSMMGSALIAANRPQQAIASIERAIAIRASLAGAAHSVADDRFKLARALIQAGRDHRRALELADAARAAFAADLALGSQATLLRVLQEREVCPVGSSEPVAVDLQVVAATHHDLDALIAQGRFRRDLHARLAACTLHLPALRDRVDDLGLLIAELLARTPPADRAPVRFTADATAAMLRHDWPSNIRELAACLVVSTALARGEPVRTEHLPETVRAGANATAAAATRRDAPSPPPPPPARPRATAAAPS